MVAVGIRVEGLAKLQRDLQGLGADVEDLKDAMAEIAAEGARLAASFTPVRTGQTRRSIRGNRAKARAVVTAGGASMPWVGPLNYGWPAHNMRGVFFLQRADEAMRDRAPQMLRDGIDKAIKGRGLD